MSDNRKVIGFGALVMMVMTAVFGFRNVINQYAMIGPSSMTLWFVGTLVYFLPLVLMMSEYASANEGKEGGVYSWVESSMGPKWAFFASWTYFFANIFYFATATSSILVYGSWGLFGRNIFGENAGMTLAASCIALFWINTWVCTKGVKWLSRLTTIAGSAALTMGFVFIAFALISVLVLGNEPAQAVTFQSIMPEINSWGTLMTVSWLLFALGGAESIGVYVNDTKGGIKTFVKGVIVAALVTGGLYILGAYATSLVLRQDDVDLTNGIFSVFNQLGSQIGVGPWITNFVGVILAITAIGGLALWTAAPAKIMFSELPKGLLPDILLKTDKQGTPVNALWIQAVIVTVLMLIPGMGIDSIETFMQTVISMTALNSLIPIIFLIIGYMGLRIKHNDMPRSFKISKSNTVALGISGLLLVVFFGASFVTSIPAPSVWEAYFAGQDLGSNANPWLTLGINFGGLTFYMGLAWTLYARFERRQSGQDSLTTVSDM